MKIKSLADCHSFTTAGKFNYERNDCTVRALSVACGKPYHEAHALLGARGRRLKRGFRLQNILGVDFDKSITVLGCRVSRVPELQVLTLAKALRKYRDGTFIFRVRKHVFAVRDGIAFDTFVNRPGKRVTQIWEVLPL